MPACETVNTPVTSSSFDPLIIPGQSTRSTVETVEAQLEPGQFVTATVPNTAFYNNKPGSNQDADKLLDKGTAMKVVSVERDVVKVELDSGDIGFVPTVMVNSLSDTTPVDEALPLDDSAYQVYPPLPDGGPIEPLPILDPTGLPPDGALPTILDPDAPALNTPNPPSLDEIPVMEDPPEPEAANEEKALDPVAEEVRKKVEAAMKEDAAVRAAAESATDATPATD